MFDQLIALFSGWYMDYVETIRDTLQLTNDDVVSNPEIWSAYVPWEQIIAAVVLVTLVICLAKFVRSVICQIL